MHITWSHLSALLLSIGLGVSAGRNSRERTFSVKRTGVFQYSVTDPYLQSKSTAPRTKPKAALWSETMDWIPGSPGRIVLLNTSMTNSGPAVPYVAGLIRPMHGIDDGTFQIDVYARRKFRNILIGVVQFDVYDDPRDLALRFWAVLDSSKDDEDYDVDISGHKDGHEALKKGGDGDEDSDEDSDKVSEPIYGRQLMVIQDLDDIYEFNVHELTPTSVELSPPLASIKIGYLNPASPSVDQMPDLYLVSTKDPLLLPDGLAPSLLRVVVFALEIRRRCHGPSMLRMCWSIFLDVHRGKDSDKYALTVKDDMKVAVETGN